MIQRMIYLALAMSVILVTAAHAGKPERWHHLDLFGRKVVLMDTDDNGRQLEVEGKVVAENGIIELEKIGVIGQTGYAIGIVGTGGNGCSPSPFVITFVPGQKARFDGPIGKCLYFHYVSSGVGFVFETVASAYGDGERRTWTPEGGFSEPAPIKFTPEPMIWQNALDIASQHPSAIYSYQPVAAELSTILGSDEPVFKELLSGLGEAKVTNNVLIGKTCPPNHGMCDEGGSLIIVDVLRKRIYLAWRRPGEKVVVRPDVKVWPQPLRKELADWARPFK